MVSPDGRSHIRYLGAKTRSQPKEPRAELTHCSHGNWNEIEAARLPVPRSAPETKEQVASHFGNAWTKMNTAEGINSNKETSP